MRKLTFLITLLVFVGLLSACKSKHEFYGFVYDQPAYNFELTDYDGKRVKLSDFTGQGKIVLIFFGYTHCPDVCPDALTKMKLAYDKLSPEEKSKVQVLFISVDPERDTPEVLKGYVPYYDPSFIGLVGTPEEIAKTAKEYKVYYKKVEGESQLGYLIDHTSTIYLVTPDMKLKLLFTGSKQEPDKMAEDIKFLLRS